MIVPSRSALAVIAVALQSATAIAQLPTTYCTPGTPKACVAAALTTAHVSNGTEVTVRVTNLEGAPINGVTQVGAAQLHGIDLIGPATFAGGAPSPLAVVLDGAATAVGDVEGRWGVTDVAEDGAYSGYALYTDIEQAGADLVGCNLPAALGYPYYRTCGATGEPGALVFRFTTPGTWTAGQLGVTFGLRVPGGDTACEVPGTLWDSTDVPNCVTPRVAPPPQSAQSISFTSTAPNPAYVGDTYAVGATATSGLAVALSSLTPSTCTVTGNTVSFAAEGPCMVAADQAGSASYLAAPQVTQALTIGKRPQAVAFTSAVPSPAYVGDTYSVSASATSGLDVAFSSMTPLTCSVSGSTVSFAAAGPCTVAADQPGDASYLVAPQVTQAVTVAKRPQVIAFAPAPPTSALFGSSLALGATGGASGNPVVLTSLTPATCTVMGSMASLDAIGDCTVAADQAGNAAYLDADRRTVTVAVVWPFGRFEAPVIASPALNTIKAGQAVPLKFSLGGDRGPAILAADSPASAQVACATGTANEVEVPTVTATASSLTYDATSGLYTYVWKTDKGWAGTCRQLTLRLTDGTSHAALFSVR